jgi:tetratricopeptide (TPR) repeat protein
MLRPAGTRYRANPTAAGNMTNGALKRLSMRNWMKIDFLAALLLLVHLPSLNAKADDSLKSKTVAADSAYQEKNWGKAKPIYEQLVRDQPDSYRNLYRLGVCLRHTGQQQPALAAFQKAQAKGAPAFLVAYNVGALYASMGQSERAFEQLVQAVNLGYSQPEQMSADPDLKSIRSDARFTVLLTQAKHNQAPCLYRPENRQFDFWVGDWNVVTTQENSVAGTSHIERTIGDCVIWENWSSLGDGAGYTGKSYNTYNPNLKRWEQFWVDNSGGIIHFVGGLKDNVMDFYTEEIPQPDGTKLKRHLQFFNLGPDKVRQFSQGSTDGGKNWSVEYDLTYDRKK